MMDEFIGFIDYLGTNDKGLPIYRFDFTYDRDAVWGEQFNVAPAGMMPRLDPDKNTLSHSGKVVLPKRIDLARENMCYSMQDCFDGIIALAFTKMDSNDDLIMADGKPFVIRYGESLDDVKAKLSSIGVEFFEFNEVEKGDESVLDNLMEGNDDGNEE